MASEGLAAIWAWPFDKVVKAFMEFGKSGDRDPKSVRRLGGF